MNQEDQELVAVFDWIRAAQGRFPELELAFHVENERHCTPQQGAWRQRKGVRAGVPDILIDVARCGYHGLRVELKVGKNTTTNTQRKWIAALERNGYCARVCYGAEAAVTTIRDYMEGRLK